MKDTDNKKGKTNKRRNVKLNSNEKAVYKRGFFANNHCHEDVLGGQLRQEILGILLFTVAVLFTIALIIYGKGESTGVIGSAAADFLFKIFGSSAYVIPVILAYAGVLMFFRKSGYLVSVRLIGLLILVVCSSLTADLVVWDAASSQTEYNQYILQTAEAGGGLLGSSVSWLLAKMIGYIGTIALDIALGITGIVLITNVTIASFIKFVFKIIAGIFSFIAGIFIWLFEKITKKRDRTSSKRIRKNKRGNKTVNSAGTGNEMVVMPVTTGEISVDMDDVESIPSIYRRKANEEKKSEQINTETSQNTWLKPDNEEVAYKEYQEIKETNTTDERFNQNDFNVKDNDVFDSKISETPETFQVEKEYIRQPQKQRLTTEKEKTTEVQCKLNLDEDRSCNLPPLSLLKAASTNYVQAELSSMEDLSQMLEDTLASFGVKAEVVDVSRGPMVTRFEVHPGVGVKVSKIVSLADDLALAFAAPGVRIEAPIPGKAAIGIEVPNKAKTFVLFREVLESPEFKNSKSKLTIALGKDIAGKTVVADMTDILHLLVAGSTGSGKSVCLNSIIGSILYKATPDEVKLLMIDPKRVELSIYDGIPHLLAPVVTDSKKAAGYLKWVVEEMENRYKLFQMAGTRNIAQYNEMISNGNVQQYISDDEPIESMNDEEQDRFDDEETQNTNIQNLKPLPYIVVILDELADLMMVAAGEVEDAICRLAFMARAAGIHLILATQRPSVDVVTGIIKANIPSRIAFAVSSQVDSRIILDSSGAERLLGKGDMLFHPIGLPKPIRVQGAFVSDQEVASLVAYLKDQGSPTYQARSIDKSSSNKSEGIAEDDELFADAARLVVESGEASISKVQRRFRVGYARAARLIDTMEVLGIIGAYEGSKARKVLIGPDKLEEILSRDGSNESDIA